METNTTPTISEIVTALVSKIESNTVTPYGIHTVINSTFKILGVSKEIRPQMMYNYSRNGLIAKGVKGSTSYTKEQVITFVIKYTTKHSK